MVNLLLPLMVIVHTFPVVLPKFSSSRKENYVMLQGNHNRHEIKISRKNKWIIKMEEMMIESHAIEKGLF